MGLGALDLGRFHTADVSSWNEMENGNICRHRTAEAYVRLFCMEVYEASKRMGCQSGA